MQYKKMISIYETVEFDEELLNHEEGSNTSNLFKYDYINIEYGNKAYRIHPSQIQIIL